MKELMLDESIVADVKELCNAFAFPYILLSQGSETTFNNQDAASVLLYQNSVIPDANNYIEQFNDMLDTEMVGVIYTIDFSHLSCFSHDEKQKSETKKILVEAIVQQFTSNLITYKRALELLGEPFDKAPELYFYQLPNEFQNSIKNANTAK
jgi:hypothetical protein